MKTYKRLLCHPLSNTEKNISSFRYAFEPESSDCCSIKSLDTSHKHAGMTGMNIFNVFCLFLLYPFSTYAHHSKDHLMLLENTEQIILNTQQGSQSGLFWILWVAVFILALLGFVHWWKKRL